MSNLTSTIWKVDTSFLNNGENPAQFAINFTLVKSDGTAYPGLSYLLLGCALTSTQNGGIYYPIGCKNGAKSYAYAPKIYYDIIGGGGVYQAPLATSAIEVKAGDFIIFSDHQEITYSGTATFNVYYFASSAGGFSPGKDCNIDNYSYYNMDVLSEELNDFMMSYCTQHVLYPTYLLDNEQDTWRSRAGNDAIDTTAAWHFPLNFDLKLNNFSEDLSNYHFISYNMRPYFRQYNLTYDSSYTEEVGDYLSHWETHLDNNFRCYKSKYNDITECYEPDEATEFIIPLNTPIKIRIREEQLNNFYSKDSKLVFDYAVKDDSFSTAWSKLFHKCSDKTVANSSYIIKNINYGLLDKGSGDETYLLNFYVNDSKYSELICTTNGIKASNDYSSYYIAYGDIIRIINGFDCDSANIINYFNNYQVKGEPLKLDLSIEAEEEWTNGSDTDDCHFKFDTIITFKLDLYSGDIYNKTDPRKYVFGMSSPDNITTYIEAHGAQRPIYLQKSKAISDSPYKYCDSSTYNARLLERYTAQFRLEDLLFLIGIDGRDDIQDLSLTWFADVVASHPSDYEPHYRTSRAEKSFSHTLRAPIKKILENFTQAQAAGAGNANKILYYWNVPESTPNEPSIAGYCVEVERKVNDDWEKVRGLTFDATSHNIKAIDVPTGITSYELLLDPDYKNPFEEATPAGVEMTFVSSSRNPGKDCEAYLVNYNAGKHHSFYFVPENIGINKGEEFRVTVYPYIVYSQYTDETGYPQPSAFLTNDGITPVEGKVSKGTVRVYYNNEWKEGQVWVYTGSGWKQAEAVYAYNDGAWKESQ